MEIFNIFSQLQVMETIQNHSTFTFFFFYFFSRRHFANRNKAGCLVLAHHEHFEPNIGQGFNIPGFKCSELCEYLTSSFMQCFLSCEISPTCISFQNIFNDVQYVILKNDASICDPTKILFKSKVYLPFCSPTDKIVIEIIVGWGTTNSKPPRSIL